MVYEGVKNSQGENGKLFQGQKFWLSLLVPSRAWFVGNIIANGGVVVPLEKQADILLVDHRRKNLPPNTHSFKYVELSIRNGKLEHLEDHATGLPQRAARPVGSVTTAPKGTRAPFTEADDQFLWNWVKPVEQQGGSTRGNALFQQLEAVNPRHTHQSWRDRWIKYVSGQNREITQILPSAQVVEGPQQTLGHKNVVTEETEAKGKREPEPRYRTPKRTENANQNSPLPIKVGVSTTVPVSPFTKHEAEMLYNASEAILNCDEQYIDRAWESMAKSNPAHTAEAWKDFFETYIRSIYEEDQRKKETGSRSARSMPPVDYADKEIQTSPTQSPHLVRKSEQQRKQTSVLQSPARSAKEEIGNGRLPEPNEARKRSTARGAVSQEASTTSVQNIDGIDERRVPRGSPMKRKRDPEDHDGSSPSQSTSLAEVRTKRSVRAKSGVLEIPSTPEHGTLHVDAVETTRDQKLPISPTPKPRYSSYQHLNSTQLASSPLFVAQDLPDPYHDPSAPRPKIKIEVNHETTPSPPYIQLVSERDPPPASSFSQPNEGNEEDNGSPTPPFETAPEFSQVWETAQPDPVGKAGSRPATQALFAPTLGRDEELEGGLDGFTLPEPDSGWDVLPLPPPDIKEEREEQILGTTEDVVSEGESATAQSVDSWFEAHLARDPDVDEELLLQAAQATSLDFWLADMVYGLLSRGERLPDDVEGVWTELDDEKLMSGDARSIVEVERKHGKRALEERWTFLEHSR